MATTCPDCGSEDLAVGADVEALRAAIVDNHRKEHEGVIQWCTHPLCQTYEEHR